MIIKGVTIQNFMCYYGTNVFDLLNGLNLVLGDNGGGKTKFFESFEWLFDPNKSQTENRISKKKAKEVNPEETFIVKVSVFGDHFDERFTLEKSFEVLKKSDNELKMMNFKFNGYRENVKGERTICEGDKLLEYIFPGKIRRYCLFKGEEQLMILV